jgi:hypothetical protein
LTDVKSIDAYLTKGFHKLRKESKQMFADTIQDAFEDALAPIAKLEDIIVMQGGIIKGILDDIKEIKANGS